MTCWWTAMCSRTSILFTTMIITNNWSEVCSIFLLEHIIQFCVNSGDRCSDWTQVLGLQKRSITVVVFRSSNPDSLVWCIVRLNCYVGSNRVKCLYLAKILLARVTLHGCFWFLVILWHLSWWYDAQFGQTHCCWMNTVRQVVKKYVCMKIKKEDTTAPPTPTPSGRGRNWELR